jgi:hypothetical protein
MLVCSRSEGGWVGEWSVWFCVLGASGLSESELACVALLACTRSVCESAMGVACVGSGSPNLGWSNESRKHNWF